MQKEKFTKDCLFIFVYMCIYNLSDLNAVLCMHSCLEYFGLHFAGFWLMMWPTATGLDKPSAKRFCDKRRSFGFQKDLKGCEWEIESYSICHSAT